jgi:hypothetical protein
MSGRMDKLSAAKRAAEPAPAPSSLRPVRMSVDLEQESYDKLIRYAVGVSFERGLPPIHRVQVFRALLAELEEDAGLRERIADRLAK